MQKIHMDVAGVLAAWADDSPDNLYYLDTRTGIVKLVHQQLFDLRDLTDEIEKNRERFLYIPKPDRGEMRKDLRAYITQIENQSLLPILEVAFESPHVYSAFCKILEKDKDELARFHAGRAKLIRGRIDEWLQANNFEHDDNFVNPYDETPDDDLEFHEDDDFSPSALS